MGHVGGRRGMERGCRGSEQERKSAYPIKSQDKEREETSPAEKGQSPLSLGLTFLSVEYIAGGHLSLTGSQYLNRETE